VLEPCSCPLPLGTYCRVARDRPNQGGARPAAFIACVVAQSPQPVDSTWCDRRCSTLSQGGAGAAVKASQWSRLPTRRTPCSSPLAISIVSRVCRFRPSDARHSASARRPDTSRRLLVFASRARSRWKEHDLWLVGQSTATSYHLRKTNPPAGISLLGRIDHWHGPASADKLVHGTGLRFSACVANVVSHNGPAPLSASKQKNNTTGRPKTRRRLTSFREAALPILYDRRGLR
jgi:hypothetical protein